LPGVGGCAHLYQFFWWIWALQAVMMVLLPAIIITGKLYAGRVLLASLLAVLSVLTMIGSNTFLYYRYRFEGDLLTDTRAASSGFIASATLDMILLVCVAITPRRDDRHISDRDAGVVHSMPTGAKPIDPATSAATV
jgi:hypothetical protein